MKILVITAGGVVVFVLGIVLTGSLLPTRHLVSRRASYRASREQLFALIAGPQTWRPDVVRYEAVADAGGRQLVRESTRDGQTLTYELLDRVAPSSIKRRIATPNLPYSGTWTYSLEPDGDRTVVRITEDGEVPNPVFRFISHLVIGHSRTLDGYLRALGKATGQEAQITN